MRVISGWRLALRLAWRGAWRSKARSVLVLVMVLVLEELGGMAKVLAGPDL